ncbi:hypothetical protein [Pseudomonas sp. BF-RE-26]|uniref:hypothetical protein n=1 Tax=Pseudomonas sp. BF-RE-26 TaxID=2832396 RepID=UPI001CBAAC1B|nr:hypothetical protein [Pseudomonas sp. BF-RE-26]
MNSLKRFSIHLDNRYFRQQQLAVITNSVVGHSHPGIQVKLASLEFSVEKTLQSNCAGVPFNQNQTCGSNGFLAPLPSVRSQSPIHTSQFVVDASFLMDKRLVDEAAWTQNRAITPQEVPEYGDLREHIPANASVLWMCGICDKPPMPERASCTDA